MAKGKVRYVTRKVKAGVKRRKGLLSGNLMNVAIGAGAGFVSPYIPRVLGKWTLPLAFGAAGYLFKKPALLSVAGYELGRSFTFGGIATGGFQGQV